MVKQNQVETWEVPITAPQPREILGPVPQRGVRASDGYIVSSETAQALFPIAIGPEGIGAIGKLVRGVTPDYVCVPVKPGNLIYWPPIALWNRCHSCTALDETSRDNSTFFEDTEQSNWAGDAVFDWLLNGIAFPKPKYYYQAMHLVARMQERFPLADQIKQRFSIENAAQALEQIKTGVLIKPVIDPSL